MHDRDARRNLDIAELRFDVQLLAQRLLAGTDFCRSRFADRQLPIGCFGAGTGAAAALIAADEAGHLIKAVVSRGGRPDLAGDSLPRVLAPTLLIVGGEDHVVIRLNRQAQAAMRCKNELAIVPGATHLFEEPGALEHVAALASDWFRAYMKATLA